MERVCINCGREFRSVYKGKRYCRERCRVRYNYKRKQVEDAIGKIEGICRRHPEMVEIVREGMVKVIGASDE